MIGFISPDSRALLRLTVNGNDRTVERDVIVDTGFNGHLTLHRAVIEDLNLSFINIREVTLADGSAVEMAAFRGVVGWNGEEKTVEILATEGDDLLGMALLQNYEVHIEVRDGGAVTILPLKN